MNYVCRLTSFFPRRFVLFARRFCCEYAVRCCCAWGVGCWRVTSPPTWSFCKITRQSVFTISWVWRMSWEYEGRAMIERKAPKKVPENFVPLTWSDAMWLKSAQSFCINGNHSLEAYLRARWSLRENNPGYPCVIPFVHLYISRLGRFQG